MATSVAWRDLVLGAATGHRIVSVEGWEELPGARYDNVSRARQHGSHPSPVWSDQRLVTVTGSSYSADARDDLLATLKRSLTFADPDDADGEPLTITLAGRSLTATGQLIRCSPTVAAGSWNVGLIGWVAQWRCPDPLRYGPEQSLSTGLPVAGGGLDYPLDYSPGLDYGSGGDTGQLTLDNSEGTADAAIVFDVVGPLPSGFEISATGQRLTYPTPVPAGQHITIDTAAGTVLAEGTADRRGELTHADWLLVPKAGSLTVQFTNLGGTITLPTAETRRNLATDPRATAPVPSAAAAGWSTSRWFGSGGAGTHTWASGAADGPAGTGIATYLRKTWTAAPSGNADTGFANTVGADNGTESTGLPVSGGTTYTISSYLRPSSGKDGGNIHVWWHDANGVFLSEDGGAGVALPAGAWTRLTATLTAPAGAAYGQFVSDVDGGTAWAAGDTLDGTGLLIDASGTIGGYFDGSTAGSGSPSQPGSVLYAWTGTPNASASVAQVVQPGPQLLTARWKETNW